MTQLVAKFSGFFFKKSPKDPVFIFFSEAKARERKRVYSSALRKANEEQRRIMEKAN